MSTHRSDRGAPGLASLGWTFLRIGAVAFGGLGAALAIIERVAVERRGWFSAGDIADALAFVKPLPGSTVIQVVTFLGWRIRRWPGALVATLAFLAPSFALMVTGAILVTSLPDTPLVSGALAGIQVAVVGLLANAIWKLAQSEGKGRVLLLAQLVAFGLGFVVNAALVVIGIGAGGTLLESLRRKRDV